MYLLFHDLEVCFCVYMCATDKGDKRGKNLTFKKDNSSGKNEWNYIIYKTHEQNNK